MALEIYKRLFSLLEKNNLQYCLYKDHTSLSDSFNGNKDVDILVPQDEIDCFEFFAIQAGFKKSLSHNGYPMYFIGRDANGKMALLDVEIKIPVKKPLLYRLPIDWGNLEITTMNHEGIAFKYAATSWRDIQACLRVPILHHIQPNSIGRGILYIKAYVNFYRRRAWSLLKRILQIPPYRCNKGTLIYIKGSIDSFWNEPFYHFTGRKVIHFSKWGIIRKIQLLQTIYLKALGNMVLVEREKS